MNKGSAKRRDRGEEDDDGMWGTDDFAASSSAPVINVIEDDDDDGMWENDVVAKSPPAASSDDDEYAGMWGNDAFASSAATVNVIEDDDDDGMRGTDDVVAKSPPAAKKSSPAKAAPKMKMLVETNPIKTEASAKPVSPFEIPGNFDAMSDADMLAWLMDDAKAKDWLIHHKSHFRTSAKYDTVHWTAPEEDEAKVEDRYGQIPYEVPTMCNGVELERLAKLRAKYHDKERGFKYDGKQYARSELPELVINTFGSGVTNAKLVSIRKLIRDEYLDQDMVREEREELLDLEILNEKKENPHLSESLVFPQPDGTMINQVVLGELLRKISGVDTLSGETFKYRKYQKEVINATLAGKDIFGVLPTGHGKSMCFQVPALVTKGKVTIVFEPLVVVIEQQVSYLQSLNLKDVHVYKFGAGTQPGEDAYVLDRMSNVEKLPGGMIVYTTPEKIFYGTDELSRLLKAGKKDPSGKIRSPIPGLTGDRTHYTFDSIWKLVMSGKIARFVIDEAHYLFQLDEAEGFRDDFKKMPLLRGLFPDTPISLFTGTANKKIIEAMSNAYFYDYRNEEVVYLSGLRIPGESNVEMPARKRRKKVTFQAEDDGMLDTDAFAATSDASASSSAAVVPRRKTRVAGQDEGRYYLFYVKSDRPNLFLQVVNESDTKRMIEVEETSGAGMDTGKSKSKKVSKAVDASKVVLESTVKPRDAPQVAVDWIATKFKRRPKKTPGRGTQGIVFCHTVQQCNDMKDRLKGRGIPADVYHSKVGANLKELGAQSWLNGDVDVICATSAFAAGVDNPHCRFVIHLGIPRSIHEYLQEAGRAGRDREKKNALCIVIYDRGDFNTWAKVTGEDTVANGREIVSFCENISECRRRVLARCMNEDEEKAEQSCRMMCDVCIAAGFRNSSSSSASSGEASEKVAEMAEDLMQNADTTWYSDADLLPLFKTVSMSAFAEVVIAKIEGKSSVPYGDLYGLAGTVPAEARRRGGKDLPVSVKKEVIMQLLVQGYLNIQAKANNQFYLVLAENQFKGNKLIYHTRRGYLEDVTQQAPVEVSDDFTWAQTPPEGAADTHDDDAHSIPGGYDVEGIL